ncbi:MAG TPA: hypothetical protein VK779_04840 [Rhizomicrobium sp.]|jgi:hypothetical protein|nr:hypothetical protein [Rhizomicrobium sp.]
MAILLILLGIFHVGNGLWMLFAPDSWYHAIPGVTSTGPINHHFINDVGLAFIVSGIGLLMGARAGLRNGAFALAGAAFPLFHSFMHIAEWITDGFPQAPDRIASEVIGVVAISFLGAFVAWRRYREGGV